MSPLDRKEVAAVLEEIATLLELQGENPFKIRAYGNAARAIEALDTPLEDVAREGRLREIKGVGEAIAGKIAELLDTGRLAYLDELRARVPPGLLDMLSIPGLGPKRLRLLHDRLGVATLAELAAACREGRVAGVEGFGEKSQAKILQGIENLERYQGRFLHVVAAGPAAEICALLREHPRVGRISIAGSLRRGRETVGDVDLVATSNQAAEVMASFVRLGPVQEVLAHGLTKSSVRVADGLQVDLRIVSDEQFPFALHHFTGSKEHNVALRGRALQLGWKMNEYGLFPAAPDRDPEPVPCRDEAAIFAHLGLTYIPPELREDTGEIEAAAAGALPELIAPDQIRGALHVHTSWSDGVHTLRQMAVAARALGWEYLGIADHSCSSYWAGGLGADRLRQQIEEIRSLNEEMAPFRILAGSEVDILGDGTLDYPDELLAELDYTVISIHQQFSMSASDMTRRIVTAMENPMATMLGHPTGRLLLQREPYAVDLHAVIEKAAELGVAIELNANPFRLDLDWRYWKRARDLGVPCCINPDAHATDQLAFVALGVGIARKGWLTARDVLNTRPAAELVAALRHRCTAGTRA